MTLFIFILILAIIWVTYQNNKSKKEQFKKLMEVF